MIYVSAWLVYLDGDVNYDYIYSDTPSYGIISPDVSESGTAFLIHKTGAMAIPESTNMNIWSSYGHIQSPYTFRGSNVWCVISGGDFFNDGAFISYGSFPQFRQIRIIPISLRTLE